MEAKTISEVAAEALYSWLEDAWPRAQGAFATMVDDGCEEAADTVARFLHDLSGVAAMGGHDMLGQIARAGAGYSRGIAWHTNADRFQAVRRLWTAVETLIVQEVFGRRPVDRVRVYRGVADLFPSAV